jgi:hypothetical protein
MAHHYALILMYFVQRTHKKWHVLGAMIVDNSDNLWMIIYYVVCQS